MRKIWVLVLAICLLLPAACTLQKEQPSQDTEIQQSDIDAFLRGENKELMELFNGEK